MPEKPDPSAPIALLFTLPEEAAPLLKRMEVRETHLLGAAQRPCYQGVLRTQPSGPPLIVFLSGAGIRNAAQQTDLVLQEETPRPRCLLICGFAGGLRANMPPGSLVLADRVVDGEDEERGQRHSTDSRLVGTAESVRMSGVPVRRGTLLTIDRILTHSDAKRALALRTQAIAVDMETAGAVQAAEAVGVPWLAVRAITDGVADDMPFDFNALADADGNVDPRRVIRAALCRPWKIPALLRLGTNSWRAARNLAVFVEALLRQIPEG